MKRIKLLKKDMKTIFDEAKAMIESQYDSCDLSNEFKIPISDYLKVENAPKAKIKFTITAYLKMWSYIVLHPVEIAWHCTVKRQKDNEFLVTDAFLYPQKVTATTVETDDEKYAQWVDTLNNDVYNDMHMQCHSHVLMSTNPSGTDLAYYRQQLTNTADDSFYIFLIMNKKHERWCHIYDKKNNLIYENNDIDITIVDKNETDVFDIMQQEINKYCENKTYYKEEKKEEKKEETKAVVNYEKKENKEWWDDKDYWAHYEDWERYRDNCKKSHKDYVSYREYLLGYDK